MPTVNCLLLWQKSYSGDTAIWTVFPLLFADLSWVFLVFSTKAKASSWGCCPAVFFLASLYSITCSAGGICGQYHLSCRWYLWTVSPVLQVVFVDRGGVLHLLLVPYPCQLVGCSQHVPVYQRVLWYCLASSQPAPSPHPLGERTHTPLESGQYFPPSFSAGAVATRNDLLYMATRKGDHGSQSVSLHEQDVAQPCFTSGFVWTLQVRRVSSYFICSLHFGNVCGAQAQVGTALALHWQDKFGDLEWGS